MLAALGFAAAAAAAAATLEAAGAPWDVAISRRPYIAEATGELLLQLDDPSLAGKPLHSHS